MATKKAKMRTVKIPKNHYEIKAFVDSPSGLKIAARQVSKTLEVDIAGEIGWDVDDVQINAALREGEDYEKVLVRVNSPGGNAWTGVAIYNRLVEVDVPVETRIMGEAASAASIIAMAGDEITINEASSIRVHYPYVGVVGNAGKLRMIAQALDEVSDMMVDIYTSRTGMSSKDVKNYMEEDRSLYSAEAKKLGFVDKVLKSKTPKASTTEAVMAKAHSQSETS